jgi:hypothetical protein
MWLKIALFGVEELMVGSVPTAAHRPATGSPEPPPPGHQAIRQELFMQPCKYHVFGDKLKMTFNSRDWPSSDEVLIASTQGRL